MISRYKVFYALKVQMENATAQGKTTKDYAGLCTATLAIIQVFKLNFLQAKKVVNYVGFYISDEKLLLWVAK